MRQTRNAKLSVRLSGTVALRDSICHSANNRILCVGREDVNDAQQRLAKPDPLWLIRRALLLKAIDESVDCRRRSYPVRRRKRAQAFNGGVEGSLRLKLSRHLTHRCRCPLE